MARDSQVEISGWVFLETQIDVDFTLLHIFHAGRFNIPATS
jgi:hypothetical protein